MNLKSIASIPLCKCSKTKGSKGLNVSTSLNSSALGFLPLFGLYPPLFAIISLAFA
jgi:hypothetical protein